MASVAAGHQAQDAKKEIYRSLLGSGIISDVKIMFCGTEQKAHKAILSEKSRWFRSALETKKKNDDELIIALPFETKGWIKPIRAMMTYIYTGEYSNLGDESTLSPEDVLFHLLIHHLGHRFHISGLPEYSRLNFIEAMTIFRKKNDEDAVANLLKRSFRTYTTDANTARLLDTTALCEFRHLIENLKMKGQFEGVCKRMEENPHAAIALFSNLPAENGKTKILNSWVCSACGTTYWYSKKPQQPVPHLPLCPFCTNAGKDHLKRRPLPKKR